MSARLENRIALVTGASRGLGAAVAKALAAEGAHVLLLGRTVGGLEETDDAIQAAGGKATLIPQDLSKLDQIDRLGPAIAEKFGRLDILVANAGQLGETGPLSHSNAKVWDDTIRLNLTANYRLIRTLDPLLRGSDAGRAIFVTSGVVGSNEPFWSAYAISKAGLDEMARIYAAETKHTKLRVNLISPGILRTDMRAQAFPGEDASKLPLPQSVTARFVELALPDCDVHGQTLMAA